MSMKLKIAIAVLVSAFLWDVYYRIELVQRIHALEVMVKSKPDFDPKDEYVKRATALNTDTLMDGIKAGYTACRLGIPFSNYVADVQAEWDRIEKRISKTHDN